MSESNVELTRRFGAAYDARDSEAIIAYCDPSIEYHAAWAGIAPTIYHGHEGMRRWHRDLQEAWGDEIRVEPEAIFELGEHTLIVYVVRGRGRQSGAGVAMPGANVMRWREGRLVYLKAYLHQEDALRDLGVSEHELEPIEP
jgi:ketosteroid isomerase-like protein